jgi:hypothetical protein
MMHRAARERYRGALSALRLPESSISASASAFSGFWRSFSALALPLTLVLALALGPTLALALTLGMALALPMTPALAMAGSVRIRPTTRSTPPQGRHLRLSGPSSVALAPAVYL